MAAALMRDGDLVMAVEEERFRRVKHWAGFPTQSIRACLAAAGLEGGEIDMVAVSKDRHAHLLRKAAFVLTHPKADILVYASSCENLPNILLEAMASGRPIACSSRGPMPEILRDAGVYFDSESPPEIAAALRKFVLSPQLRQEKARLALTYSRQYSWERCANETFAYLADVASQFAYTPTTSSAKARSA